MSKYSNSDEIGDVMNGRRIKQLQIRKWKERFPKTHCKKSLRYNQMIKMAIFLVGKGMQMAELIGPLHY